MWPKPSAAQSTRDAGRGLQPPLLGLFGSTAATIPIEPDLGFSACGSPTLFTVFAYEAGLVRPGWTTALSARSCISQACSRPCQAIRRAA